MSNQTRRARPIERFPFDIHHVVFPFRGIYLWVCKAPRTLRQTGAQAFIIYRLRFFLGTFFVELIITVLGRFQLRRLRNVFKRNKPDEDTYPSSSQGRHLILLIASIAHAMYFVMMGSRGGFPVMFLAYVVSAFSRALLSGELKSSLFLFG